MVNGKETDKKKTNSSSSAKWETIFFPQVSMNFNASSG